jgi:HAMP domain-containing protein
VGIDGLMAILLFVLSLIMLIAAAASGYQSLDLLPTGIGVLYALAGAVAACGAVLTFAVAVLIRRIDALAKLLRQSSAPGSEMTPTSEEATPFGESAPAEEVLAAAAAIEALASVSVDQTPAAEDERPININRTGHLPSLETIETGLETPEPEPQAPPSLIGSYSSAGANYKIFDDGSIEAETSEGTLKFASMSDFKRHLLETKGNREVGV